MNLIGQKTTEFRILAYNQYIPITERIAKAMRHAGVSITVTSITDMAAFLIGSTTVSFKKGPLQ